MEFGLGFWVPRLGGLVGGRHICCNSPRSGNAHPTFLGAGGDQQERFKQIANRSRDATAQRRDAQTKYRTPPLPWRGTETHSPKQILLQQTFMFPEGSKEDEILICIYMAQSFVRMSLEDFYMGAKVFRLDPPRVQVTGLDCTLDPGAATSQRSSAVDRRRDLPRPAPLTRFGFQAKPHRV